MHWRYYPFRHLKFLNNKLSEKDDTIGYHITERKPVRKI